MVDLLDESTHTERVLAAALLSAAGRSDRLLEALALADVDWRDTLMWTYGTAFDLPTLIDIALENAAVPVDPALFLVAAILASTDRPAIALIRAPRTRKAWPG